MLSFVDQPEGNCARFIRQTTAPFAPFSGRIGRISNRVMSIASLLSCLAQIIRGIFTWTLYQDLY